MKFRMKRLTKKCKIIAEQSIHFERITNGVQIHQMQGINYVQPMLCFLTNLQEKIHAQKN
jgi:hypothetical protein